MLVKQFLIFSLVLALRNLVVSASPASGSVAGDWVTYTIFCVSYSWRGRNREEHLLEKNGSSSPGYPGMALRCPTTSRREKTEETGLSSPKRTLPPACEFYLPLFCSPGNRVYTREEHWEPWQEAGGRRNPW